MQLRVHAICPGCGLDLIKDEPIERAGISMEPYGQARFNGVEISLTHGESSVLWALVKAGGEPLSRAIIAERYGYEGDRPDDTVDVLLSRIRRKLAPHGAVPIRNRRGAGVYIEG